MTGRNPRDSRDRNDSKKPASGHGERTGRTPGSADRAAMPRSETGHDLGEPGMLFERVGQAGEPPAWPCGYACHAPDGMTDPDG